MTNYRSVQPSRAIRFATAGLLGLALLASVPPASASHVGEDVGADEQLLSSNTQLLNSLKQFESAQPAVRAARLQQLVQKTAQRRERLLALLERNPQLAAARLLPPALRARLPAEAQAIAEQDVRLSGVVFAHVSDNFEHGVSKQRFFLHVNGAAAQRLELHLADPKGSQRDLLSWSGKKVDVGATRLDGHLLIGDKTQVQAAGGSSSSTSSTSTVAAATVVQGDQKTLFILANFTDKALSCTQADLANRMLGATGSTVNVNFKQSSNNLVSFSGDVVGPFPIPYASTGSCDYSGWSSTAEAAAKVAGYDPAQYKRVQIITPSNSTCGWAGLAYMPGTRSWNQSCGSTGISVHELGHNLSLHHAATLSAEYGDGSDPMGGAKMVQSNAANRTMAGWLPSGALLDVSTGGTYAVSALALTTPTVPQVLRIAKPDTNEFYYVSLRQSLALDANLSSTYLNNVSIHRATGTLPTRTYLLANLAAGQNHFDAANGITIANQGLSANTVSVNVTFGGAVCTRAAPVVAVTPSSQTSGAGTTLGYTVTVTNKNSTACGSTSFNLAQVLPATGFSGALPASIVLAPGLSGNVGWSVSAATGVVNGSYGIDVRATDASGGSSVGHAMFTVFTDTIAPTVSWSSPSNGASLKRSATLSAKASDDTAVTAVEFYDGTTLIARDTTAPYSVKWNLRKVSKGSHSLKVRALDAAGNKAEQTISVTVN